jgi:hypothetical protein
MERGSSDDRLVLTFINSLKATSMQQMRLVLHSHATSNC